MTVIKNEGSDTHQPQKGRKQPRNHPWRQRPPSKSELEFNVAEQIRQRQHDALRKEIDEDNGLS